MEKPEATPTLTLRPRPRRTLWAWLQAALAVLTDVQRAASSALGDRRGWFQ